MGNFRRFSQRNSLVTLSEINITPLLDLAFVLLIIFIITTPLLEQSMDLELPSGGDLPEEQLLPQDVATVEINLQGDIYVDKKQMDLDQMTQSLISQSRLNPKLVIRLRADKKSPYGAVASIIDRCQKNNLTNFSLQTEFEPAK